MLPSVALHPSSPFVPASPKPCAAASACKPQPQTVVFQEQTNVTRVDLGSQYTGTSLGRTVGVEAYKAVDETVEPTNPFAATILRFIDAQLRRDVAGGATAADLQTRLEAGLAGFEEGYGQAFEQLSASGVLTEELRADIATTRNQVLAGIQKLADELGVSLELPEKPVNETPPPVEAMGSARGVPPTADVAPGKELLAAVLRDVQIIEQLQKSTRVDATYQHLGRGRVGGPSSAALAYGVRESRDFSLKLRTADGDSVTIRLANQQTGVSALYGQDGAKDVRLQGTQSSAFQFSVEGELDEGELSALTDLLHQVGDISQRFFAGDLDAAFTLAADVDINRQEIASFAIRWSMSRTEVASSEASPARKGGFISKADAQLRGFMDRINRAGDMAERIGQPRTLVADLLDWVLNQSVHKDLRAAFVAPAARAFL